MNHRRFLTGAMSVVCAISLFACDADSNESAPDDLGDHAIATFQVVDETFKVELITQELVDNAELLLAGEEAPPIPVGSVVRDDPGPNSPWTWHLDPTTVEFADFTTEVCDGLPSFVEDDTITSDLYCPWSAQIIALEPA